MSIEFAASLHVRRPPRLRFVNCTGIALAGVLLAACSAGGGGDVTTPAATAVPAQDAATRTAPVVPGRRSRVFIFAGVDDRCRPLAAPQVTVTAPPAQGDIAFVPGQPTTIAASAKGTCAGSPATGTGVYYTARAGATGTDRFTVEARSVSGEVLSRTFEVRIEP